MTRDDLINGICEAGARMEGFYLTQQEAIARGITWPTLAQANCNPGNIRQWSSGGRAYPQSYGYVNFRVWVTLGVTDPAAREAVALVEGWRVFRVLMGQYLDNKYTSRVVAARIQEERVKAALAGNPAPVFPPGHDSPTLYEMYEAYAPSSDRNRPREYAEFVAKSLGVPRDKPLKELIS